MKSPVRALRSVLACLCFTSVTMSADVVSVTIDAAKPGAKIDRHLFGQFAEHPGRGVPRVDARLPPASVTVVALDP